MADLAEPARFNFDLDLGHARHSARVFDDAELSALIENARAEGRAAGRAEAESEATTRAAEAAAGAAEALAAELERSADALDRRTAEIRAEAADLARLMAGKLAMALIDSQPQTEVEALIAECMASLERAPHLVVRCHADLAAAIDKTATGLAAEKGFEGRLVVMGEPDIAPGDCRIEWADGGVVRDRAAIEKAIDDRVARFVGARPSQPETAEPSGEDQ